MSNNQKDLLGDVFLWSLAIALIGIAVYTVTDWKPAGMIAGVALTVFGLMCAALFLFRVIAFLGEIKAILGRKR